MYEGKLVRLRAFEAGDLDANHAFVNDYETLRGMMSGIPFPASEADEQQWLNQQSSYTRGEYQFAVEDFEGIENQKYLLTDFCFREMNLHRLKVTVFAFNEPALKCYEANGFVREGLLRQELWRDGAYRDVVILAKLAPGAANR